jgi:hypothetical protein
MAVGGAVAGAATARAAEHESRLRLGIPCQAARGSFFRYFFPAFFASYSLMYFSGFSMKASLHPEQHT